METAVAGAEVVSAAAMTAKRPERRTEKRMVTVVKVFLFVGYTKRRADTGGRRVTSTRTNVGDGPKRRTSRRTIEMMKKKREEKRGESRKFHAEEQGISLLIVRAPDEKVQDAARKSQSQGPRRVTSVRSSRRPITHWRQASPWLFSAHSTGHVPGGKSPSALELAKIGCMA